MLECYGCQHAAEVRGWELEVGREGEEEEMEEEWRKEEGGGGGDTKKARIPYRREAR